MDRLRYSDDKLKVDFAYDALGRRLYKNSVAHYWDRPEAGTGWNQMQRAKRQRELGCGFTLFGWDGDTLAWESSPPRDDGDTGRTVHYLYEPGSFVPVAQALRKRPIVLHRQPDWRQREYDFDQDPLWQTTMPPQAFDAIAWYHCDHLGTPMELTDQHGNVAWAGQYKAWGEVREERSEWAKQVGMSNPIRFQGQYHDHQTGLHYNRHRYYDPDVGRFVSKDPLSYGGGVNIFLYVANPTGMIDPLGLCSSKLNNALGGIAGDHLQAHHIVPEQIWKNHTSFFVSIGLGGDVDKKQNGVLMPDREGKAKQMGRMLYHCGSHAKYSAGVDFEVSRISAAHSAGMINNSTARDKIAALQNRNRMLLQAPGVPGIAPKRLE
ncbi:hypothetical protein C4Q26_16520 [Pseudomonas sp. SWI44]|nr:hypothetical protein C4Q26_16520 [Pseudomonas sp. SWI44]